MSNDQPPRGKLDLDALQEMNRCPCQTTGARFETTGSMRVRRPTRSAARRVREGGVRP